VAADAQAALDLNPCLVVFEFACGACNSLDEYSVCLTPKQFKELEAILSGQTVSVGIELETGPKGKSVVVSKVNPNGPAYNQLSEKDRIVRVAGKPVASPEAAAAALQGEAGTTVEVTVIPNGETAARTVKLQRRVVVSSTVEVKPPQMVKDAGGDAMVAHIKVTGFLKNTPQELKEAILDQQSRAEIATGRPLKAIILDLRDNGGGSLKIAVEVAEMFLTEGVIAETRSNLPLSVLRRCPELKSKFKANNRNAFEMPLYVLVNGSTASAAELFAAALKENKRATLVGVATYGKWSVQCTIPLHTLSTGLRLTVAKFYSPEGKCYEGQGLVPPNAPATEGLPNVDDLFVTAVLKLMAPAPKMMPMGEAQTADSTKMGSGMEMPTPPAQPSPI
jgi:carboxyl-terminal processing protease